MIITVFEDSNYSSLFPLNINRASCELRCGAFTNLERINNLLSTEDSIQLVVRDELTTLMKERYPNLTVNPEMVSQGIWLNGRGLWNENKLIEITSSRSYTNNGILMANSYCPYVVCGCHRLIQFREICYSRFNRAISFHI